MTEPRASTSVSEFVPAPPAEVFRACIDPALLVKWRVPDTMTASVQTFEPHIGGRIRMTLTYADPADAGSGKSGDNTDTYTGRFADIVPNQRIVEIVTFEADDPAFSGEMSVTTQLAEASGGTMVTITCDNIPSGISPEDNITGTRQSLASLAAMFA